MKSTSYLSRVFECFRYALSEAVNSVNSQKRATCDFCSILHGAVIMHGFVAAAGRVFP
jgi:hypothetical protein